MTSIHQYLKTQILKVMKTALEKQTNKSAILVTDDRTTKILDSVLKVHELNDLGIGVLVNIKFNRERVNVAPIYFLSPTLESIEAFCKDYSNAKALQYGSSVHLFLCGSISEAGLSKIKRSPVKKYLKTFQEVYCDFLALEDQIFYFNRPDAFNNIYMTKDQMAIKKELSEQAIQLFSTIVSMEENPYIRYAKSSQRAEAVATVFQDYLKQMMPNMKGFNPREKRATVLIMDRSQDPIAPLTHEVTYQCMIKDHLGTEPKFLLLKQDEKEKKENDDGPKRFYYRDDPLWNELRHANMGDVVPDVAQRFQKFKKTNAVAQRDLGGGTSKPSLVQTVRDLPMYKKMAKSFSAHFSMTKTLSNKFSSENLAAVGDIEQSLITGIDPEGKDVKLTTVQKELTMVLKDPNYSTDIKVRLLAIYIISQGGISDDQQRNLFYAANISPQDAEAIYNLRRLNVTIKNNGKNKTPRPSHYADMQTQAKKLAQSKVMQTRFEPLLSLVLRRLGADKLSEAEYPFIGEKPKMGSSVASSFGGRSHRKKNRGGSDLPRVIVFMVGGGSFNEVRQCYTLSKALNRPIFMGSSHFVAPSEYVKLLKGKGKDDTKTLE